MICELETRCNINLSIRSEIFLKFLGKKLYSCVSLSILIKKLNVRFLLLIICIFPVMKNSVLNILNMCVYLFSLSQNYNNMIAITNLKTNVKNSNILDTKFNQNVNNNNV